VSTFSDKVLIKDTLKELHTIQDWLRWATSQFNASDIYYGHGADNPWDEAVQLILPSLSLPINMPKEIKSARLTLSERHCILERIIRRINERIPVAYLTNTAWFCGQSYYVNEQVLIPRSPIGEFIEDHFYGLLSVKPAHILDMCTGSGCIAIACAEAFPEAEVDAVDISRGALAVAECNIEQYGLENRVTPIYSDLFNDLPRITYDLIVTNPPYVDAKDMNDLPPEFLFEPRLGLEAGEDGLKLVQRILSSAGRFLKEKGVLICEVGNSQGSLIEKHPDVPFLWLQCQKGGEGLFVLTKEQVDTYFSGQTS